MFLNIIDKLIFNYITNFITIFNNNLKFNIDEYIKNIDYISINNIIRDEDNLMIIKNIIINYIYIYYILYINYDNKIEDINIYILN